VLRIFYEIVSDNIERIKTKLIQCLEIQFYRNEIAGAFGDVGIFIPLFVGLITFYKSIPHFSFHLEQGQRERNFSLVDSIYP